VSESELLCDLSSSIAFVNLDQSYAGRSLVVLKKSHYEDPLDVPEEEFSAIVGEVRRLARAVQRALASPRINYAILGNEVPHVHWHVIPRYPDDPNWGHPPWPIKERKRLTAAGYRQLAQWIRKFLDAEPT